VVEFSSQQEAVRVFVAWQLFCATACTLSWRCLECVVLTLCWPLHDAGNIASIYLVDAWGRKLTTAACLAGACVAALLFAAAPAQGVWPLLAACAFNAISTGGWNALDLLSAELYPTAVRSTLAEMCWYYFCLHVEL
jgi:MFS family permease